MSNISIEKSKPEDVKDINNILYQTWIDTYPNEELGVTVEDIKNSFKDSFTEEYINNVKEKISNADKNNKLYLSAKDGDKIVGVCMVKKQDEQNLLQTIYILPEYQGLGIGQMLWDEAKKFLDPNKETRLEVVDYTKAVDFYKKLGFVETGNKFQREEIFKSSKGVTLSEIEMIRPAENKIEIIKGDFKIKQEAFEGPLDLLLSLIEKRKLLINDISLAKVTDDYIEYVKAQADLPMAKAAQFIVIASTLLLIKSKSLLPTLELTEEESESIDDLETRLKIYQRIKEAAIKIEEDFGANPLYPKIPPTLKLRRTGESNFYPPQSLSMEKIKESILNFTKSLPKVEKVPEAIIKKVISLEETISKLTQRVRTGLQMSFKEFSGHGGKEEKVNIIVSFLAMLELVKQGVIFVKQHSDFDDIHMETKEVSTPSYD